MATPTTDGGHTQRDVAVKLKVPECVHVPLDKALRILDNAGFLAPQVRYREDYAAEDTVIEQYPASGQLVNRHIGVQLVVSKKSYIRYLPAIFQKSQYLDTDFLREFLWIFQHLDDTVQKRLDRLHDLFRPLEADGEFLPWLASWVALTLDDDWPETKKRRLLRHIVQLYKVRGTVRGIKLFVKIFTDAEPNVIENNYPLRGFRVGDTSRVGVDVIIPPVKLAHCFTVEMPVHYEDTSTDMVLKIHDIIRAERPAHTQYYLRFLAEPVVKELREFIQVGIRSGVGIGHEVVETLPEGADYDTRLDHERAFEREGYDLESGHSGGEGFVPADTTIQAKSDGADGADGAAAKSDGSPDDDDGSDGSEGSASGGGSTRTSAKRKAKSDKSESKAKDDKKEAKPKDDKSESKSESKAKAKPKSEKKSEADKTAEPPSAKTDDKKKTEKEPASKKDDAGGKDDKE